MKEIVADCRNATNDKSRLVRKSPTENWATSLKCLQFFSPRRYEWGLDPTGNPYGGGGVNLLLRDMAKLGQLMLDDGTWQGRRIVSQEFAASAGSPLYHLRNIEYGYLWWIEDYPYKDRTVRTFSARGAGGQTVTVIPELDLVVATFGGSYSSRKGMGGGPPSPFHGSSCPRSARKGTTKTLPSSNGCM